MSEHRIIQGDVLAGLATLPDGCVQCTVTSPPYFGLRNYGTGKWEGGDPYCEHDTIKARNGRGGSGPNAKNTAGATPAELPAKACSKCGAIYSDSQIGMEETPEQFIQKMVEVFREVRRVTRDDGVLWLNFGDSYASKWPCGTNRDDGRNIMGNSKRAGDRSVRPPRMGNGLKEKDLMGIPWRVAFALQADGWYLRSAMPWIKRNCMPESTTDRPTSAIEYIFLMAKSPKYFYDGEAIRVPSSESYQNDARPQGVLRQRVNKRSKYPNEGQFERIDWAADKLHNGKTGHFHEKEKASKKQDQTGNPTYTGFNERYKARKNEHPDKSMGVTGTGFKGHSGNFKADGTPFTDGTRNYRNSDPFFESWQGLYSESENPLAFIINPQSRPELHFATFPDLLAATCIKAGTSEYGCCPKCGAPYQRIVEASGGVIGGSWHPHSEDEVTGQVGFKDDGSYRRQFKGWQPTCKCYPSLLPGQQPSVALKPCLVLDPFMGSGTVAVVARELNRSSIGCELNPAYVKIIRQRLQADSQLDSGVVSYRFDEVPA